MSWARLEPQQHMDGPRQNSVAALQAGPPVKRETDRSDVMMDHV